MADKSTDRSGPYPGGTFMPPALGFELWGAALAGAAQWNGKIYEGWAALGSEWLDFVNHRLKEDLKLPPRVCACHSPDEVRDTCTAYWRQAADDYQKEFAVMAKLGNGFLSTSLSAAQTRADETARELRQRLAAAA
jgi:hypothetical protein